MTTTGRRGRLFRRDDAEFDDQTADLSEDEHAWWAAREEVAGVPTGHRPDEPPAEAAPSQFADYWTAESLFEGQAPPTADQPVDESTGPAAEDVEADLPGGMDLDSAHLVLQIEVGVEWEAITKAHRRLAMQYHPDRLIAYSPAAQELGRVRMAEINAAHATLRALHHHG